MTVEALTIRNLARRCVICGNEAQVVCVGSDALYGTKRQLTREGGVRFVRMMLAPATRDIDVCLPHAVERWQRWPKRKRS